MAGCGSCGANVEVIANQVGRSTVCPSCDAYLRACRHCRHFDAGVAKECKEPFAEVPRDKDAANFCEFFQIGEGRDAGLKKKDDLLSAAESLFKKR